MISFLFSINQWNETEKTSFKMLLKVIVSETSPVYIMLMVLYGLRTVHEKTSS